MSTVASTNSSHTSPIRISLALRLLPLLGVLLIVVAGCGDSAPKALSVVITDDAISGFPAILDAGIYELTVRNDGSVGHDLTFLEVGDTPVDQFFTDFAPVLAEGGPVPEYTHEAAGMFLVEPGSTASTTLRLAPATYVVLDTNTAGQGDQPLFITVEVTGKAPSSSKLPDGPTIEAHDWGFDISGLKAGDNTITFRNAGPTEVHFAEIMSFPTGVDEATARAAMPALLAWDGSEPTPDPMVDEQPVGISGIFSSGGGGTFNGTFEAGRTYAVLCFIADRSGGAPHAISHDMWDVFTIG